MPPHCDAMDGPVVKASAKALEAADVGIILPYVHKEGEEEIIGAFEKALAVRKYGAQARELAALYFFETAVRVHRAGEGAPYTGLKPPGLDVGPMIPAAEKAIESGSVDDLTRLLSEVVAHEVKSRFDTAMRLKARAGRTVEEAREYVEAMLGLQVWAHKLYICARSAPHEEHGTHVH